MSSSNFAAWFRLRLKKVGLSAFSPSINYFRDHSPNLENTYKFHREQLCPLLWIHQSEL
jgi:hypothetical protein